jgi:RNA polymerase sigma-70 factor (ECF subfamily)
MHGLNPKPAPGRLNSVTQRFYDLVVPQAQMVLRVARCLLRDPGAADDLAQETMIKAYKAIDRFQEGTDVRAWLMTILRNARIDFLRSAAAGVRDLSLDDSGIDPPDGSDNESAWEHPQELLERFSDDDVIAALQQLPEEIRWTLLLVDVEKIDHSQAAQVLEVPVGTIKSRAFRGRAMLRKTLLPLARQRHWID